MIVTEQGKLHFWAYCIVIVVCLLGTVLVLGEVSASDVPKILNLVDFPEVKGDGILDKNGKLISGTDDTDAIQRVIDSLPPHSTLVFPPRVFRVTRFIKIPSDITLEVGNAILVYDSNILLDSVTRTHDLACIFVNKAFADSGFARTKSYYVENQDDPSFSELDKPCIPVLDRNIHIKGGLYINNFRYIYDGRRDFKGNYLEPPVYRGGFAAIFLAFCRDSSITNTYIRHFMVGIRGWALQNVKILNNFAEDLQSGAFGGGGIAAAVLLNWYCYNNLIAQNSGVDTGSGIVLDGLCCSNIISLNSYSATGRWKIPSPTAPGVGLLRGIELTDASMRNQVVANIIRYPTYQGIYMANNSNYNEVTGGEIFRSYYEGIRIQNASYNRVSTTIVDTGFLGTTTDAAAIKVISYNPFNRPPAKFPPVRFNEFSCIVRRIFIGSGSMSLTNPGPFAKAVYEIDPDGNLEGNKYILTCQNLADDYPFQSVYVNGLPIYSTSREVTYTFVVEKVLPGSSQEARLQIGPFSLPESLNSLPPLKSGYVKSIRVERYGGGESRGTLEFRLESGRDFKIIKHIKIDSSTVFPYMKDGHAGESFPDGVPLRLVCQASDDYNGSALYIVTLTLVLL